MSKSRFLKTKVLVILLFLGDINNKDQDAMGMQNLEILSFKSQNHGS